MSDLRKALEAPDEYAVHAVAVGLAEAGFVDPDDGTVGHWGNGESVPTWVLPSTLARAAIDAYAAHLLATHPADPE